MYLQHREDTIILPKSVNSAKFDVPIDVLLRTTSWQLFQLDMIKRCFPIENTHCCVLGN